MTEPNIGCARNQGTTQFCAEAVEAHKELREARAEIKRLKANLKEARRLLGLLCRVCDIAHHAKHDRHTLAEGCPIEKRIDVLLEKLKEST